MNDERFLRGLLAAWLAGTLVLTFAPFWPLRALPRGFAPATLPGGLDFALNLALYVPAGALLRRLGGCASTATAAAALLSLAIESAQMYVPHRYPCQLDLVANTVGALLGAALLPPVLRLAPAGRGPQ